MLHKISKNICLCGFLRIKPCGRLYNYLKILPELSLYIDIKG